MSLSYMNAEKYGLDRIYFGGCFIRGKWYAYVLERCLTLSFRSWRNHNHFVVRNTFLEQGNQTGPVLATRGILVRAFSVSMLHTLTFLSGELLERGSRTLSHMRWKKLPGSHHHSKIYRYLYIWEVY